MKERDMAETAGDTEKVGELRIFTRQLMMLAILDFNFIQNKDKTFFLKKHIYHLDSNKKIKTTLVSYQFLGLKFKLVGK